MLDDRYLDGGGGGFWKWNHALQIKKGRIFKGEGLDPFNTQSPFRIIIIYDVNFCAASVSNSGIRPINVALKLMSRSILSLWYGE